MPKTPSISLRAAIVVIGCAGLIPFFSCSKESPVAEKKAGGSTAVASETPTKPSAKTDENVASPKPDPAQLTKKNSPAPTQERPAESSSAEDEGGRDDGKKSEGSDRKGAKRTDYTVRPNARQRVWFETLLSKPFVPTMAVKLLPYPDESGFFILSRNGDLWSYDLALDAFPLSAPGSAEAKMGHKKQPAGIRIKVDDVAGRADLGSIGGTLDPNFAVNRFIYIWYTDKKDENLALDRFTWTGDAAAITKSRTNVIRFSREGPPKPYHMGGIVQFLPDGTLLIASGDAEREHLSQEKKSLNGKLLRIKPKLGPEGGYEIPADNPHVGDPEWAPEIMATGLRAPFRGFLLDGKHLVFGDVGSIFEEVNVWSGGPTDFGWGHGDNNDGPNMGAGIKKPILWWNQKEEFACDDPDYMGEIRMSAFALAVYSSPNDRYAGLLTGKLIWGDLQRGWIRAGKLTADLQCPEHEHVGHLQSLSDLFIARDGYAYATTYAGPARLVRMRLAEETVVK